MADEDLVQHLAEVLARVAWTIKQENEATPETGETEWIKFHDLDRYRKILTRDQRAAARAVLNSRLVVPRADYENAEDRYTDAAGDYDDLRAAVLDLAQRHARRGPQLTDGVTVAAELRALVSDASAENT